MSQKLFKMFNFVNKTIQKITKMNFLPGIGLTQFELCTVHTQLVLMVPQEGKFNI